MIPHMMNAQSLNGSYHQGGGGHPSRYSFSTVDSGWFGSSVSIPVGQHQENGYSKSWNVFDSISDIWSDNWEESPSDNIWAPIDSTQPSIAVREEERMWGYGDDNHIVSREEERMWGYKDVDNHIMVREEERMWGYGDVESHVTVSAQRSELLSVSAPFSSPISIPANRDRDYGYNDYTEYSLSPTHLSPYSPGKSHGYMSPDTDYYSYSPTSIGKSKKKSKKLVSFTSNL
eukprot:TRINITY_DN1642_c0_g2_i2.p1 TRINITY_DN1642_c0_g2~~TRINITY_DN1642_c0_g2_i2.p1  ORF type:complete len:231 (-),score=63.20 TRINITY_DN1642_c0_g2_i2:24-716(-)